MFINTENLVGSIKIQSLTDEKYKFIQKLSDKELKDFTFLVAYIVGNDLKSRYTTINIG